VEEMIERRRSPSEVYLGLIYSSRALKRRDRQEEDAYEVDPRLRSAGVLAAGTMM
jgi:hypothetical protein